MQNKLLIVMPDKHLGNFVIALIAIKALRKQYKNAVIIFDAAFRGLVEANLGLENIIFFSRSVPDYLKFIQQVRRVKPEISIALESCNVSAWMSYLSGAKRRIAPNTNKSKLLKIFPNLFNEPIQLISNCHRLQGYYDVMESLHLKEKPNRLQLVCSQQATVDALLKEQNINLEKPLICIHTGAGKPHKQWAIEKFTQLAEQLAPRYQVALIGGGAERARNDQILAQCTKKLFDLTQKISLVQLSALFHRCSLLISNDSGPMHIGAFSGIPVIALFGPTNDVLWGPLSDKAIVLRGNEPTSLASISVAHVMQTVQQMLPSAATSEQEYG